MWKKDPFKDDKTSYDANSKKEDESMSDWRNKQIPGKLFLKSVKS